MSSKKVAENFYCKACDYNTCKKYNFNKHCLTPKHIKVTNATLDTENSTEFSCDKCSKIYKSRCGIWRHQKSCIIVRDNFMSSSEVSKDALLIKQNLDPFIIIGGVDSENSSNSLDTNVIIELIKQNKELQQLLVQQVKSKDELINKLIEREPTTINNNMTTNNNQKFNLNFFLNETCKDAMNIQEFIENIKITFEDLLTIGNSGFVNGLSDIFMKQLRDLEVTKRPIHCTDSKRETIYFKENDTWEKDDIENKHIKGVIEKVEYKNVAALHQWCEENPDAKINNTPNNLLRDKIFLQTLQGDGRTRDKIIKNIAKEVVVSREGNS